jgi:hypothetical protein
MTAATRVIRRPATVRPRKGFGAHPYAVAAAVTAGALAVSALVNRHLAKKAERDNPPTGKFLEVNGVRLHYVERGSGEPLVLLHGNGGLIQDFEAVWSTSLRRTIGSSFLTAPASATATGPATSSGRPMPRLN